MLCHAEIHTNSFTIFTAVVNSALQPLRPHIFSNPLNQRPNDATAWQRPVALANQITSFVLHALITRAMTHKNDESYATKTMAFHDVERLTRRDQLKRKPFSICTAMNQKENL